MKSFYRWMLNGHAALLFVTITCPGADTRILFVSPTGDGTTGNSWQTAYQTLEAAYSVSGEGDHIHVEKGVYKETLLVNKNSIILVGGLAGNGDLERADTRISESDRSILDANGAFSIVLNFFKNAKVDGFILKDSTARGSAADHCKVIYYNCEITDNIKGGGVYINSATVEFSHCTIANNQCDREAGAISIGFESSVLVESCTIENNEGVYCGGIGVGAIRPLFIRNSIIRGNRTTGEDIEGGGVQIHGSTVEITNCLIYGNKTVYGPGAQISHLHGGLCQIFSSTILGSMDEIYTNVEGENPFIIDNSILWGAAGILKAGAQVFNSCIQGGYTGEGNISDDPLFRNPAAGDYRLLSDSPCIDTAGTSGPPDDLNGNPRPVDIAGIGREVTDTYDMGAYEFQLNELATPTPTQTPSQVDPGHTGLYE